MSNATNEELTLLKARADQMGLKYHPNIKVDSLRKKVASALNDTKQEEEEVREVPKASVKVTNSGKRSHVPTKLPPEKNAAQRKLAARKIASRLVRIRVTCMNPDKSAHSGEIFTVSNSVVGTFKKYVPFNVDTGWHVPQMILNMIQEKEYIHHYVTKNAKGVEKFGRRNVKEFAVEILDPLSEKEMKDLATQQAMANSLED